MSDSETTPDRANTKYGDGIADDHWERVAEAEREDHESPPPEEQIEVDTHTIVIQDFRNENDYEFGLRWQFALENGSIFAIDRAHYLEGRTQWDPMSPVKWADVPEVIQSRVLDQLNVSKAEAIVDFESVAEFASWE